MLLARKLGGVRQGLRAAGAAARHSYVAPRARRRVHLRGRRGRHGVRVRAPRVAGDQAPPGPQDTFEPAERLAAVAAGALAGTPDVAVEPARVPLLGPITGDSRRGRVRRAHRRRVHISAAPEGEGDEEKTNEKTNHFFLLYCPLWA